MSNSILYPNHFPFLFFFLLSIKFEGWTKESTSSRSNGFTLQSGWKNSLWSRRAGVSILLNRFYTSTSLADTKILGPKKKWEITMAWGWVFEWISTKLFHGCFRRFLRGNEIKWKKTSVKPLLSASCFPSMSWKSPVFPYLIT